MGLSAEHLESMRNTMEAYLPSTCTILRKSSSADGYGGRSETWRSIGTAACMVKQMPRAELLKAGQPVEGDRWKVLLPADTDVTAQDRILVGDVVYAIESLHQADYLIGKAAYCRRLP
jgi:SPP1 family predicted phage head-tail adaptor